MGCPIDTVSTFQYDGKPKVKITWQQINEMVDNIASWLKIKKAVVVNIYGVSRGGLIPAVMLSHKLNLPLMNMRTKIQKHTLIIDDIEDEGNTMAFFKEWEASALRITLISKKEDTNCDYHVQGCDKSKWIVFPWEE